MQPFGYSSKCLAAALSPDARIESVSSGAELLAGYSAQELIGKPVAQILSDASAHEMPGILRMAGELGSWEGEIVHQTRAGKALETRGIISLLSGKENCHSGFILVSVPIRPSGIHELKHPAALEIAGKLRGFAHDLNNPLAVTLGFVQLLMLNSGCQGQVLKDVEKVYSEMKRIARTVERLHTYAISLCERPQESRTTDVAV